MTYLDTSALVKRFVVESGSDYVQTLFGGREPVATAKIAYAEVYAALTRRRREAGLSEPAYAQACRQFDADWPSYVRVDFSDDMLPIVRRLIQRYPLRGSDAIHLASALSLRDGLSSQIAFVAADTRLLSAASAERLQTINPETA